MVLGVIGAMAYSNGWLTGEPSNLSSDPGQVKFFEQWSQHTEPMSKNTPYHPARDNYLSQKYPNNPNFRTYP